MGKSKAPAAPDPKETASAQTATNVGTAIANSYMGNVNQNTPDGSLNYSYSTTKWTDPLSGAVYDIPVATATQTLSPAQQAIKDQQDAASKNLATLANSQSGRLNDLLGTPFTLNGAPAAGSASSLTMPNYTQFGAGPQLQSSVGDTGNIMSQIAGAGDIKSSVANAGDITKTYGTDYGANVQQVQDALMARLQPSLDQNRSALEQKLANQGLQPGSDAYNRAIDAATRQENDARYGAILNAGQEQTRLANLAQQQAAFQNAAQAQQYGQNANDVQLANAAQQQQFAQNQAQLQANNTAQQQAYSQAYQNAGLANSTAQQQYQNQTSATAANNALQDQTFNAQQAKINAQNTERANWMNEQYALRNQPINEISSLLSGGQVTNPNFVPTQGQSIPNIDYASMVQQKYNADLNAYNQSQANSGAILGGLAGLFSLSDKTAKKDIKKVGGLYEYRYKGEGKNAPKRIGVMAQEVEKVRPGVVRKGADGKKRVNYGALFAAGSAR
ncbi:tail fiber domain-containing protein [Agrobacterium sp. OT33]|uniref:tail fiber domain-containing protein n=1 Tax=Agrobacterium sp. OT33 TaxID=2815338 RepID=UPI001A9088DD|nr:tail fiber domain-containing protein [Agrobacterium sp. OT33]MBO0125127.1 tail fiber domain-containing protein [Agrobacterium sp. OT33]